MQTIIYVPIIHSRADMGSLAAALEERGIAGFGKEFWMEHEKTIVGFWNAIIRYFDGVKVTGFNIYQDGLIADGAGGQYIVDEALKAGSKNYELVSMLLKRGAVLVKTEDWDLVNSERNYLLKIVKATSLPAKILAYIRYRMIKNSLLKKRDKYIIGRILETLPLDGTGILFVGAYHNVAKMLPAGMNVIKVKDPEMVREYQELLPFYTRNKKRFADLAAYLLAKA